MSTAVPHFDAPGTYRIKILADLDPGWSARLAGMRITSKRKEAGPPVTVLQGELADQAALAGVLTALYDLGYSLQSVKKLKSQEVHTGREG